MIFRELSSGKQKIKYPLIQPGIYISFDWCPASLQRGTLGSVVHLNFPFEQVLGGNNCGLRTCVPVMAY
jgi:hypothetical protein